MDVERGAHPWGSRVTINDVSRTAGVSRSTTSRALNGTGYVSAAVRERVLAAAAELDYVADVAARNFKRGRGISVGLLIADLRDPLHADLAAGVSEALVSTTLTLTLAHTTWDEGKQRAAAEAFVARRVEGLIITPLGDRTARFLADQGVPTVEVDGLPSSVETDRVLPDAREAGRVLARHVDELGHRRIALVLDEAPTASQLMLLDGVADVLGPPAGPGRPESRLLRRTVESQAAVAASAGDPGEPTAVLAGSTGIARRLWEAAGKEWHGGTALAVFGDAVWMDMVSPRVTTVSYDAFLLGTAAADRLLARLAAPTAPIVSERVPVELRARSSTLERSPARSAGPGRPPEA